MFGRKLARIAVHPLKPSRSTEPTSVREGRLYRLTDSKREQTAAPMPVWGSSPVLLPIVLLTARICLGVLA